MFSRSLDRYYGMNKAFGKASGFVLSGLVAYVSKPLPVRWIDGDCGVKMSINCSNANWFALLEIVDNCSSTSRQRLSKVAQAAGYVLQADGELDLTRAIGSVTAAEVEIRFLESFPITEPRRERTPKPAVVGYRRPRLPSRLTTILELLSRSRMSWDMFTVYFERSRTIRCAGGRVRLLITVSPVSHHCIESSIRILDPDGRKADLPKSLRRRLLAELGARGYVVASKIAPFATKDYRSATDAAQGCEALFPALAGILTDSGD